MVSQFRLVLLAGLLLSVDTGFLENRASQIALAQTQTAQLNAASFTAAQAEDYEIEANQLSQQGLQKYRNGQIKESIQTWKRSLDLYQKFDNKLKIVDVLNQLGLAYFAQGQYQKAKELHKQSLTIAKEIKYREGEARSLNGLGNACSFLKENLKAIEIHQQALSLSREIGSKEEEVRAINGLGNAYRFLREYSKAMQLYEQSLEIARRSGYAEGEAKSLTNLGGTYLQLKQYEKGIEFLKQSLVITKQIKDRRVEAITLDNLAFVYVSLGRYLEAIEVSQQALKTYQEIGNRSGEAQMLKSLGVIYRNLERYQEAIAYHQKSLTIAIELKDKLLQSESFGNLGVSNHFLGQYQAAIEFQQKALALYRELKFREGEGLTLGNLGLSYGSLNKHREAIEFYQQSLVISREIKDRLREGNALTNIGSSHFKLKQYSEATTALLEAIKVYEKYLRFGLSDTNKVSIFDTYARSYRGLQQVYIAQNKSNDALVIAEGSRAKSFVELLVSRLAKEDVGSKPTVEPLKIESIQRIARERNSALVEYSINGSVIYIWVIEPTGKVTFRQVDLGSQSGSLIDLVTGTRQAIGITDRATIVATNSHRVLQLGKAKQTQQLQKLHKLLIDPIADLLPIDPNQNVIFIPQGALFSVPFAALPDQKGKYLIEKHTILTAPSIQVLELTRQQRNKSAKSGKALVMGNPTMPIVQSPGGNAQQLPKLAGAETEARVIAPLLNTTALIGAQGTKATIKQQMLNAYIIHLATHGLLDDVNGLGSAIALAPDNPGQPNDGLLTAEEILNMKLTANLVVLSACDTGRGRITGDGVIGLSRALISAGVPSVLVSLWSVPDAPTADLMTEFYKNLQERKLNKAQSLREAMKTVMKTHPNPIDWAAFTLIGEAE